MAKSYKLIDTFFRTNIVRADDYNSIKKAEDIIKKAKKEAGRIVKNARDSYNIQKAKGYNDGCEKFKVDSIKKSMELTSSILDGVEKFEKEIAKAVIYCVRKIISDYYPNEALVIMIKNAMHSINIQKNIILKMSEKQIEKIKDEIPKINKKFPGVVIETLVDNSIPIGDCVVFSDFCTVKTGIQNYLKVFEEKINKKFVEDEE